MEIKSSTPTIANKGTFPAKVATILTSIRLVINRGLNDGIRLNQRVLVYNPGTEEITDPQTGKSLGYLEIVRGTGRVIHLQENMATIESDQEKRFTRELKSLYIDFYISPREIIHETTILPFENPEIGDLVKPI
jgi:hypothetical protein